MILQVYCVRDRQTVQFMNPMFLISNGQAIRSFADEVNKPVSVENFVASHPEDFDLYLLGTFDTSNGLFDTRIPEQIALGSNLRVKV